MNKKTDIASLRREYAGHPLNKEEVDPNPLQQFSLWFEEALGANVMEPNAMTLATLKNDQPTARVVLLKGLEDRAFVFYTNYGSDKAREIQHQERVCLNFYWPELARQVRIEGAAQKVPDEVSDAYFQSRPRGSQIAAWASKQSQPLESREKLEQRWQELEAQFNGKDVARPPGWGGYAVNPDYMEFWQGRESRMHDRIVYRKEANRWSIIRLFP